MPRPSFIFHARPRRNCSRRWLNAMLRRVSLVARKILDVWWCAFFAVLFTCANAAELSRRAYVDFAMRTEGDAARGRLLFTNASAACGKCHSTDGSGSSAGPDLGAIGDKLSRRELVRAILEPSASIVPGYDTTILETKADDSIQGVVKQSTAEFVELKGAEGSTVRVATRDIVERRTSTTSLMPEGLESAFTLQEFADLVSYLETLRQPASALAFSRGMPAEIPVASRLASFEPLFGPNVRVRHPSWFGLVPGSSNRWVILEHEGRSWIVERGTESDRQAVFLDLSRRVRVGGGSGLLSLAFHPRFRENRRYFLTYQREENGRAFTLLEERRFSTDFRSDSGDPPKEILRIECSTTDHTGGGMEFGPDGFLYFGMGDSGPQRDPQGHGQDMRLLLGKISRIDVDHADAGRAYAVPRDNPFRERADTRPEIWASGFREPWRISFDPATGECWVGDVGQDSIEELAIVRAGENHGWNVFEGFTPYSDRYRRVDVHYTPPVFAYPRRFGASITGGFVYRGQQAPSLVGAHICGDFNSRRLWAVVQTNRLLTSVTEIGRPPGQIVSFARDDAGELYVAGYDDASFYRVNLATVNLRPRETRVLAETSERTGVRWRYTLQPPAREWIRPDFLDATWNEAPGGFGTRDTPGAVVRTEWRGRDIWLRREFTLSAVPARSASIALRVHHDEDAEIYLNGIEVTRLPRWTTGYTVAPLPEAAVHALRAGRNVLAIHCRQNGGGQYIDAGLLEVIAAP